MSHPEPICQKCSNRMELGYIPDATHSATYVGRWIRGRPRASFLSMIDHHRIQTSALPAIPIVAYRCQSCGFVELYAREDIASK